MSDSMLSTIQPRAWGREVVRVSTTGDSEVGKSGEAKVHFRDLMPGANSRPESEEVDETASAPLMTGSPADLAAVQGHKPPPSGARSGQEEVIVSTFETEPEPWTFMAPTVSLPRGRFSGSGNAPFRIYARAASEAVSLSALPPVAPIERDEDPRR
ncbi:MAG: hypothetical protein HQM00_03685 [Magnetococcales bacterium]|nr:hypothetical protein [Magnetococcales bacterium]